jgi:DnaJ-class molecular chaperone
MIHPHITADGATVRVTCPTCEGRKGRLDERGRGGRDYPLHYDWIECPECEGEGMVEDDDTPRPLGVAHYYREEDDPC